MRTTRPTVVAVAWAGVHPFELAVPCEVFGLDRPELGVPWYRFSVCRADPGPVPTAAGFTIDTPHGLEALETADTVVIPGWDVDREPPDTLLDAVRAAHRRGGRVVSVCSGVFVLAAAGLLDGRRATTHWIFSDLLAERYPQIEVDPGVLYVDEGDVMTSAGTAAGIDLCLHVVRLDFGAEIANAVARRMVVSPHRDGGQAQFVERPVEDPGSDTFAETLAWLHEHLHEEVTVADLARRAAMSPRTFARRFRSATGTTPYQWLIGQRVLAAQRLLESTDDSVDVVAERCGFGSAAVLRQHFHRITRSSPSAYRRTFRTAQWPVPSGASSS